VKGKAISFVSVNTCMRILSHGCFLFLTLGPLTVAVFAADPPGQVGSTSQHEPTNVMQKGVAALENYFGMAGSSTAAQFRPQTQQERTSDFLKSLVNPWAFASAGFSAGLDHLAHKPEEWGQGAGGYGRRFANIEGQYLIQKTVTFGLSSALHEDNRYFGSGKKGFWHRVGYAVTSSSLARNDSGKLRVSVSQVVGVAAGAGLARFWLPGSQNGASQAAISFGLSMAGNAGTCVAKEFLPDVFRRIVKK